MAKSSAHGLCEPERGLVRRIPGAIIRSLFAVSLMLPLLQQAEAVTVASQSPQGEVAKVRQVVVRFSEPVVPFGDAKLPDPFAVSCSGTAIKGQGRWVDDSSWRFDFPQPLPPGVRCDVTAKKDWQPAKGLLEGKSAFSFRTGGPAIDRILPYGGNIEEGQYFIVQLTGPAVPATAVAHAWCEVDGIGERIPATLVTGDARNTLLLARKLDKIADRVLVLGCQRPLPADTDMRFVWGKGIAAAVNPGIVTSADQRFDFHVRAAFTADFSCERERANAGCLPLRPMNVSFTSPVPRALLAAVRLQPPRGDAIAPTFDADDKAAESASLAFKGPFAENTSFTLTMPAGIRDSSGRALANAGSFPLKVATGNTPPIAKFSAAPFGVIEANAQADAPAAEGDVPMLPVTLRHVQNDLRTQSSSGVVRDKVLTSDADMLAWFARVKDHHETTLTTRKAGLPADQWYDFEQVTDSRGRVRTVRKDREIGSRELSLLRSQPDAKRLDMPMLQGGDPRPFEVVGIPLKERGFHVVEIESARLGESLLDKKAPMYVRTGVLVTNLGLHFKAGRESSLAFVTTLDRAQPVAGAEVTVNDCNGKRLWSGSTDAQGLANIASVLPDNPQRCISDSGWFVTARKADAGGAMDTTFVFTSWQKGIETWRFNVPTSGSSEPDSVAHTVFDRTLLRAGETVSMKHFLRLQNLAGLADFTGANLPTQLKITHEGTGQSYTQPLQWKAQRSALSEWKIPAGAKLGVYQVTLERTGSQGAATLRQRSWQTGSFRVEEFRLPLVDARINGPRGTSVAVTEVPLSMQLQYFAGGAMQQAKATVSAMLKPREAGFNGYEEFSFNAPRDVKPGTAPSEPEEASDDEDESSSSSSGGEGKLVADKLPVTTDRAGAASVVLKDLPAVDRASELTAEMSFNDPNGEVQTVATRVALWPSAVVLGLRSASWASSRGRLKFQVVALDTNGKPLKSQSIDVSGRVSQVISTRKRMVGGFYAYDNRTEVTDAGKLCSGRTDDRGFLLCDAEMKVAGQVELIAQSADAAGHVARAATSVWVTRQGEVWFEQDNDDRIDLLAEKKSYEPGETARLQVRMPYRQATALVSVEREGIITAFVTSVRGDDPVIEVPIPGPTASGQGWGPNVYVSAMVLRGRVREVPWYSLFTWGWRTPVEWARTFWYDGKSYQAPTAMVDLAKPSYKLGIASLKIGLAQHELQVSVVPDKAQYGVRETAKARVKVMQGGKPLAGVDVAFAAVDEGLLALQPNDSWGLLDAMLQQRALGVETSTAQSEIIGRRHYGRKAVAAGGGGGQASTRELFDTLLVWKGSVALDANGEAVVDVPLNDSLTSFRFVAVADAGTALFGTGSASVRVTQDLQALSGLPPLVREGDRFTAMLTLRNGTTHEMAVTSTLQGQVAGAGGIVTAPQTVTVAAGAAAELAWPIDVPEGATSIVWEATAEESNGKARDRVKVTQRVTAAVPITVQQATLLQLDGSYSMSVAPPAQALSVAPAAPGAASSSAPASPRSPSAEESVKGGIRVALQPKLTGALPGIRRFFETYPYSCLEQKTSKSVGLHDTGLWQALVADLPSYLDSDGLASYFPPRADAQAGGSDRLTAYLVAAANEAGFELPAASRDLMLDGLQRFVEGRIKRDTWQPSNLKVRVIDIRKLSAIEALSRHGRATPQMLASIDIAPNVWPTAAVIDWYGILRRVKGVPDQARRLDEVQQVLRSRLTYAGTTLRFSTEDTDFWWWMMDSADANAARLVLAVLDDPAWQADLPRMVVGSLARQRGGAWLTTTANLWGSLALDKFSARFESTPVAGRTTASLGAPNSPASTPVSVVDWTASPDGASATLPWPSRSAQALNVSQQGSGKPWLTVQSLAAIRLLEPIAAGYRIKRTIVPVEQKQPGHWSRGDIARVRIEIEAMSDMSWVVLSDPVPAGATLLGSGLGRDSAIATRDENQKTRGVPPIFEERSFEAYRGYYDVMPIGTHTAEYTMRLNNAGRFLLPQTRVEAMYSPETFGELPNVALEVGP